VIVLTGMAAAPVTIAGMKPSSGILGPVMLALVMTIAAHPMRGWLTRRHLPGWAASLTMIATVHLALVVFALAVLVSMARFAALLPTYKAQFAEHVDKAISWLTGLGVTEDQLRNMAQQLDVNNLAALAGEVLGDVTGLMSLFVFVASLLLFFAIDAAWFPYRSDTTPASGRSDSRAASPSSRSGCATLVIPCG
jgi:AI-2 transport protein TqsA